MRREAGRYRIYQERQVTIHNQNEILEPDEERSLMIRGISTIMKVPVMITFLNQTNVVDTSVAKATDEFSEADYQKFNMPIYQYMDSIELAMYG